MNISIYKRVIVVIAISLSSFTIASAQTKPAGIQVNTKEDLAAYRLKIDSLDRLLMETLGQRERIVQAIGVYKAKNHIPPLQAARFKEVLEKSVAAGKAQGLSPEFITKFMNAVHDESLRIEGDSTLVKN